MKVAAVNWAIRPTPQIEDFFAHFESLLASCESAELVVFPELPCLELCSDASSVPIAEMAGRLADQFDGTFGTFGSLAKAYNCVLVAGSYFVRVSRGVTNTAVIGMPDGSVVLDVPKVVLTQFESDEWGLIPGQGLRRLPDERIGVTVCYDCEFPESGRTLAESGVLVQCVPAFTETQRGFQRVRWSCHSRAVENQVFVVHASLVGSLGREPVPSTYGSSAILTPSVEPFPESAVLAETKEGIEGVAVADLDFGDLAHARSSGDVRNWDDRHRGDWTLQTPISLESTKP